MTLATLWNYLSYLGIQPDLPLDLQKKIILCNRIALTIGLVMSCVSFVYFGVPILFAIYLMAALTYTSSLLFNRLGFYNVSRFILTFTPSVYIVIGAGFCTEGPCVSQKFALLSVLISPVLLFQVTESRKMWLGIAWTLLALLVYDPVTRAIPRLPEIPSDQVVDNPVDQTASALISFVMFVAAFAYQQRINRRVEGQLRETVLASDAQNGLIRSQNEQLQRQFDEIERQKTAIEVINHDLRLQALKAQINPHFVFNALNSIQHFVMQKNTMEALGYLSKFAKLIRQVLENSVNERVVVADELKALSYYLDLEKMRFNDSFAYYIDVDDELDPFAVEIPAMLLQPYVENAILHGLRHRPAGGGLLKLHLLYQFDRLLCVVEDNGIGRAAAQQLNATRTPGHISRGAAVTDTRLRLLNHDTAEQLSVVWIDLLDNHRQPSGTRVEITIPI
ncbi:MAG: sensor histidine kinase [Ferruginibacter sp.]|nr:sensor histidine kinase [Cytophagales bacterium]